MRWMSTGDPKNGALASLTSYSGSSPGDVSQTIHICGKLSLIALTLSMALQKADFYLEQSIWLEYDLEVQVYKPAANELHISSFTAQ